MSNPKYVYVDGDMVPYSEARLHVSSAAVKYGANVFEGLCTYAGDHNSSFGFRLHEHFERLHNSARMMQIDCDYTFEDYQQAIITSLHANDVRGDAHIRLTIFITGDGFSETTGPASLVCVVNPRSPSTIEQRTKHACVSSWVRLDDRISPPRIKAGANYQNSRFGVLEARRNGYDEAIFLTLNGKVSEGGNSCFVMIRNGRLITPPVTASILESITRETLIELASTNIGLVVEERDIDRSELYTADEAFLCGSGLEISPIVSVDRFAVGDGQIGPHTRHLWETYEAVVRGRDDRYMSWLTPIQDDE